MTFAFKIIFEGEIKMNKSRSCLFIFIGFCIGIVATVVLLVFLILFIINITSTPGIARNNSWLVLNFSGSITEKPISKVPTFLGGNFRQMELIDYLLAIDNAGYDEKISGIIIDGDVNFHSRVHMEEIGSSLERFKKSGKKVIAWLSNGDNSNYYLCTYADEIYMPDTESASLSINGYAYSIPYYKNLFDKVGLDFNVIHIGSYKGTGENYVQNEMSDELRESYNTLLGGIYKEFINHISKKRKIDLKKLELLLSSGKTIMMTPDEAKGYGFIDDKKSYSELMQYLNKYNSKPISIFEYAYSINSPALSYNKIAIVYAEGIISNYYSGTSRFYGDIIGEKTFINDLKEIKDNKSIKAVIIRVNSPGGSALASELILQAINGLKKEKPVYFSFGPIAASGGYYISCDADRIFVNPSTITGSIGVVSILMNYEKLSEKIGINMEIIKKHQYDDFLNPNRKPTGKEIQMLRNSMGKIYKEFTGHVISGRNIDKNKISKIADGRVWTGNQAISNNLADEIGGLFDVIEYAQKKNNLKNCTIVSYPVPPSFVEKLSEYNQISIEEKLLKQANFKELLSLYLFYSENGIKPATLLPYYKAF